MNPIKELLPSLQENVLLGSYTSLRIGGPADFLYEAKSSDDIVKAIDAAEEAKLDFVVLGGGTNVLVSDNGFRGLVIIAHNTKREIKGEKIFAEAGAPLGVLVSETARAGLAGLEWAAGLPGTLGGAIFGNAGTFGKAIGDILENVTILKEVQGSKFKVQKLTKEECQFGYRDSLFKRTGDVILGATLKFQKGDAKTLQDEVRKNILYRTEHHPPYQSAGCIFKNCEMRHYHKVSLADVDAQKWFERIPTGWLVDQAGLRGTKIGNMLISPKHGNFFMNLGGAKAEDAVILISLVKSAIHKKFGVLLEEEVRYIGFTNDTRERESNTTRERL